MEPDKAPSLVRFGQELSPSSMIGRIQTLCVPTDFDFAEVSRATGIDLSNYFYNYQDDIHDLIDEHLAWFKHLSPTLRIRIHLMAVSTVLTELCEEKAGVEQAEIFATLRDVCNYLVHMVVADLRASLLWDEKDVPSPEDPA